MSTIYNAKIPKDGNPNGIVDAPLGALFHKNGAFYKVNKSGSSATTWESVFFNPRSTPDYYLTAADVALLAVNTGSYLYTKTTIAGTTYGWVFLSNLTPFISGISEIAFVPTPTPTATPTPTPTPTPSPTPSILTISDGTWNLGDWTVASSSTNVSGFLTTTQVSGGPSGSGTMRGMSHDFGGGAGAVTYVHVYNAVTFDPSTFGPIHSMSFSEARKMESAGAMGGGWIVKQSGNYYVPNFDTTFSNGAWGIVSQSFGTNTGSWSGRIDLTTGTLLTGSMPDLSHSGSVMQFGFSRSNTSTSGFIISSSVDDWSVTIS